MYTINIDNQYVFKTKSLYLNCYSVNSTVWKYLDELFLKSLCLNTENLTLKILENISIKQTCPFNVKPSVLKQSDFRNNSSKYFHTVELTL